MAVYLFLLGVSCFVYLIGGLKYEMVSCSLKINFSMYCGQRVEPWWFGYITKHFAK